MQCTYDKLTLRSLGLEWGQASYKYSITHRLSATSPTRAKLIHPRLALRSQVKAIQTLHPPFVVLSGSSYSYRRGYSHDTAVSKNPLEVLIIREFGQGHIAKCGGRHLVRTLVGAVREVGKTLPRSDYVPRAWIPSCQALDKGLLDQLEFLAPPLIGSLIRRLVVTFPSSYHKKAPYRLLEALL